MLRSNCGLIVVLLLLRLAVVVVAGVQLLAGVVCVEGREEVVEGEVKVRHCRGLSLHRSGACGGGLGDVDRSGGRGQGSHISRACRWERDGGSREHRVVRGRGEH